MTIPSCVMSRRVSATEVVHSYLKGLRRLEPQLHSFIEVDERGALSQAAMIDKRISSGEAVGPLAGVIMGIKVSRLIVRAQPQ